MIKNIENNMSKIKNKKGFVILYAVVVASVVSISGILLSNIVVKQLILSSIGKETQFAYYASNVGDECAREGIRQNVFGEFKQDFGGVIFESSGEDLLCGISFQQTKDQEDIKEFEFETDVIGGRYYISTVIIKKITKSDGEVSNEKLVISRGYNIKPSENNPRQVEKVIYRDYSKQN